MSTKPEPTEEPEFIETYPPEPEHGKKRKKRKKRKVPGETIGHLNLTPMMDIMTMLLAFLVMSFANEPQNINISLGMRPPESTSEVVIEAATKVTISTDEILVDTKSVAKMDVVRAQLAAGQVSVGEVRDALLERSDHLKALENRGGDPFDGKLLVVAHETTPYAVVTAILVSAGEAKFSEYKLVLMQKGALDGTAE